MGNETRMGKASDADAKGAGRSGAVRSVGVVISWGATVLHVEHLTPPRGFDLGEGREDGKACDCFLPEQVLGVRRAPLLKVDAAGRARLVLLAGATGTLTLGGEEMSAEAARARFEGDACAEVRGAVEVALGPGALADVEVEGVRFQIEAGAEIGGRVARSFASRRSMVLYGISALAHLGVLGALAVWAAPPPHPDDAPSADQIYRIQQYLAAADEREMEEKEAEQIAEAAADVKEGGSGTRAKGEEGSMGTLAQRGAGNRYGVQGPADQPDPHIARQAALRDSAEFGMIGLLSSGAGGDPNAPTAPWGRDDSLGNDPMSARGMGLSGIGPGGGGGIGMGPIGTIGHGAGTGTGQGFGNGSGRLGGAHAAGGGQPALPPGYAAPPGYAVPPGYAAPGQGAAEAPIDPNGRFATTYRPGGGHLAAFESAVARGIVPEAEREVVSDVGARYAPPFAPEDGRALALRTDLERGMLAPTGGAFHLRLALRSAAAAPEARAHLSVHLVLDTSGSMQGESIDRARRAAQALVDRLAPTDDFSLTTFSSSGEVVVPDGLVGARREAIKAVIANLGASGGTNIGEGLQLAYKQAALKSIPEDAVRVVLLVSDGRATDGVTSREQLSRLALDAFQDGIQTSSFGLGTDYDGQLMSAIATDGAGGYYYLRDPEQIAPALSTELDRRLDPVATAVEVRVRLKKGVELLRVYGSRRLNEAEAARVRVQEIAADVQAQKKDRIAADRHADAEGGMRFFMPAFARDDSHALLLKLRVGADTGTRSLGTVELKYKDRLAHRNVTEEIPLSLAFAGSDAESAATADASVARTIQGFAAGETLTEAALRISQGDRSGAAALLEEREGILRQAAVTLNEPLFSGDAARLARLRAHTSSQSGLGDPLVLAMLLETAGRSHLH